MNGQSTNALVGPLDADAAIKSRIFTIRGVQVMLDSDLSKIYQVETRVFNQSVKRNESRFPSNFRFRLSMEEYRSLISQIVTSKDIRGETRGGRQKAPYVFTEQGVAMLSGILNSEVAVQVSIRLMNVFVAMRKAIASVAPILSRPFRKWMQRSFHQSCKGCEARIEWRCELV